MLQYGHGSSLENENVWEMEICQYLQNEKQEKNSIKSI